MKKYIYRFVLAVSLGIGTGYLLAGNNFKLDKGFNGGTISTPLTVTSSMTVTGTATLNGQVNVSSLTVTNSGSTTAPSLIIGSNADTGLARTASQTIGFIAAGAEQFRIYNDANISYNPLRLALSGIDTEANLKTTTPPAIFCIYGDTTNNCLVVSTGTAAGDFANIATGAACTGW